MPRRAEGHCGGGDTVVVRFRSDGAREPLTLRVSLLSQELSARHAVEVLRFATPETEVFRRLYESSDRSPSLVDETAVQRPLGGSPARAKRRF